jgi:hypothetical protein
MCGEEWFYFADFMVNDVAAGFYVGYQVFMSWLR